MNRSQAFSCIFLAVGSQGLAQSTWYVDTNAAPGGNGTQQAPYNTIQGGISQASTLSGDTLLVLPGDYPESINYLGKDLILRSTAGLTNTTIDGQGGSTVSLTSGESAAELDGFRVRGGTGTVVGSVSFGGGIYGTGSSFTVANCEIVSNEATYGGGIFTNGGGAVSILSTTIDGNRALQGAGMHTDNVTVLIDNCTLWNNWADQWTAVSPHNRGGALSAGPRGSLTVLDSTFRFNRVPRINNNPSPNGGAVYTETPNAFFRGCLFSNNMSGGDYSLGARGGAVYSDGPLGSLPVFEDCTFTNNHAELGWGGAIYGRGLFSDCTVNSNYAVYGAGVCATTGLTMVNSTISGNRTVASSECSGDGGGVFRGTYTNCVISNNYAFTTGGGAYQATLTDCTIQLNNVGSTSCQQDIEGGGGITESTATNCLIDQNRAVAAEGQSSIGVGGGGALSSTLTQCQVTNNTVSILYNDWQQVVRGYGGGAYDSQLTDCLVQGNLLEVYGDIGGQGGGINGGSATNCQILENRVVRLDPNSSWPSLGGGAANTTLTRCVLMGNQAGSGGALWQGSMTNCSVVGNTASADGGAVSAMSVKSGGPSVLVSVRNAILWGNSPNEVFAGNSGVINVIYSDVAGGVLPGLGNISTTPLFWNYPLGDVQLQAASPCIDTGDPTSPPDLDGSIVDMGALPYDPNYEGAPAIYCTAKLNSLGCLPSIDFTGTPSVGGSDDFFVTASNLINRKSTMAIWSRNAAALPFMGGTLCLAPPIQRTSIMNSGGTQAQPDCSGTGSFHFSQSYMASKSVVAGDRIYAQFWQRDPFHPDGTGTGLTDAVGFTVVP